jgi:hypothetical protein
VLDQLPDLLGVVLQRHRHSPPVDFAGYPAVESQLVGGGEREPGLVFVAGDVVGLDRVEPLVPAAVEAAAEDRRKQVDAADVEPALIRVAGVGAAEDGLGEATGVRPVVLPGADVEVTDRPPPLAVQRRDGLGGDFEAVDLVDPGLDREVDLALQLPLPGGGRRLRVPAGGGGRGEGEGGGERGEEEGEPAGGHGQRR